MKERYKYDINKNHHTSYPADMNKYEMCCRIFLNGCTNTTVLGLSEPDTCEECVEVFIKAIKNLYEAEED